MQAQQLLAVLAVVALFMSSVAPVAAAGPQETCDPSIGGLIGYNTPSCVVSTADGNVGVIVQFDEDKTDALRDWVDSSDTRKLGYVSDDGYAALTLPADDTGLSYIDKLRDNGLASLSYVDAVYPDIRVTVEPVEPATEDDYEPPTKVWKGITKSDFDQEGIAYSNDVDSTRITDARATIGADPANVNYDGSGVTVAVIDSGVNFANGTTFGDGTEGSDLRVGGLYNAIDDTEDVNGSDGWDTDIVADNNLHGTWVAAAAVGTNGSAPGATLYGVKALSDDGSGSTESLIRAIDWAEENDVDILSMSLGSPVRQQVLEEQIEDFLDNGGSAVVVAAGNSRMTTRWTASPASAESTISVASVTNDEPETANLSYYSSVGTDIQTAHDASPDVAAPGQRLVANLPHADGTVKDVEMSGTSMAQPFVAGGVALKLEQDPTLKGRDEQVKKTVQMTATAINATGETEVGHGMFDAQNLLSDTEPTTDQDDVLTDAARARDTANRGLSGDGGGLLETVWTVGR